jgi:hypothetical protein
MPPPPGIKKSIGEMLFEALMPVHPVAKSSKPAPAANREDFRIDVTEAGV